MRILSPLTKTLGRKITLGFAIIILLLIGIVGGTFFEVSRLADTNNRVVDLRIPTVQASMTMLNGINQSLAGLRGYMLLGKDNFKVERQEAWSQSLHPPFAQMTELSKTWTNPENVERLKEIAELLPLFEQYQQEIEDITASDLETAKEWLGTKAAPTAFQIKERLNAMVANQQELVDEDAQKAMDQQAELQMILFLLLLLGIVAAGAISFFTTRSIVTPVKVLVDASDRIAKGEDVESVDVKTHDEIGQLGTSFNGMLGKVRRGINDLNDFVDLMMKTNDETDIERILNIFLHKGKAMVGAKYAALSVFGAGGKVDKFLTLGVPEEMNRRIGRLPEGKGLLGHLQKTKEVLRLDDMSKHGASGGFPEGHVPMKALLAAPILYNDEILGNLYLTDKEAGGTFDEDDERIIVNASKLVGIMLKAKMTYAQNEEVRTYLQDETNKLVTIIDRLAAGDFTVEVDTTDRGDAISQLKQNLAKMVSGLRDLIVQVRDAVGSTSEAAKEISSASEQLAAGAQEQSAQANEVAAAVEEMARTIIENASNANSTAEASTNSGTLAQEGGHIVEQTVAKIREIADVVGTSAETVERLGASSAEIGEIVAVIDDIADQTNLLALNAAIEAARAGEQGRGFAVVADEVRKLAERTTQATKQIASMIKTIQAETVEAVESMRFGREEVAAGITLADQAGETLQNVVSETNEVVGMINQIAAASEEQSTTSEQISRSVEAISSVSNESAHGVSEIAQSSNKLNLLMDSLNNLIAQFKTGHQARGHQHGRADRPASRSAGSDTDWSYQSERY